MELLFQRISSRARTYWYLLFPLIGCFIVFPQQFLHPFTATYNFADNRGYFYQIVELRNFLFHSGTEWPTIYTPLYSYLMSVIGTRGGEIFWYNVFFLGHIVGAWYGMFRLMKKLTISSFGAILGATLFAFNSLTLYANRFNLMGIVWIPYLVAALFSRKPRRQITGRGLLLILSGHYFVLTAGVIILSRMSTLLRNKTTRKWKSVQPVVWSTVCMFVIGGIVYALPILFSHSFAETTATAQANVVDNTSYDLINLIKPNNQNYITSTYLQPFFSKEPFVFKYSAYFGLCARILFFLSWGYNYRKKHTSDLFFRFFSILLIISLLLYVGGKLHLYGYELLPWMPFALFEHFGLHGIFRKSVYFFYLISFAVGGLVAYGFRTPRQIWLASGISIALVLESLLTFYRPIHTIQQYNFASIDRTKTPLVLPNTGYSIKKYQYLFGKTGIDIYPYPDVTIAAEQKLFEQQKDDCPLAYLVYPPNIYKQICAKKKTWTKHDFLTTFEKNNISQIVLFKQKYIESFFFETQSRNNTAFTDIYWKLSALPGYFKKSYEDSDIIVFDIQQKGTDILITPVQ